MDVVWSVDQPVSRATVLTDAVAAFFYHYKRLALTIARSYGVGG